MEFHDLGKHCSAENCGQQDFLPFKCDACSGIFCLDHRTHIGHSCSNAAFNDKRVLECSKCNKVLRRPPGVAHHHLLERHIASGCVEGVRKNKPNKLRCFVKGCRGSEFVKVSCKNCRENFCFRHRHEDDHNCQVAATALLAQRQRSQQQRQQQQKPRRPGGSGGLLPDSDRKPAAGAAAGTCSGSGSGGTKCGTETGKAAARREREASRRRAATGVAAR
eukprot:jgi/Undpi1/11253/HiC_scaffold_30.g13551.m1